jgi:hypothetical protein
MTLLAAFETSFAKPLKSLPRELVEPATGLMTSLVTVLETVPTALETELAAPPKKFDTAEAAPDRLLPTLGRQTMKHPPGPNSGVPVAVQPRKAA